MDRTPGIRPRPSLWRRLDAASRQSAPAAMTALLLLLTAAPLGLSGQAEIQTAAALACVYFWSLFRPAAMSPPLVFLLGLLADLLDYTPVGVGVVTLLLVHGMVMRWRRLLVRQGFVLVWLGFATAACGAAALQWALTALLTFRLLPPDPGLFQAALATGMYPAVAAVLGWAHKGLAEMDAA